MRTRRPGQSLLLLLDIADVLEAEDVLYAVIGAVAASVHGAIRGTTDADAVLSVSAAGLGRLQKVLGKSGVMTEMRLGDADDPVPALLAVTDRHQNRVDLLAGLRGLDPQAFSRCIAVPYADRRIRVIGREDFIAMKCFAGGPQDLADARHAVKSAEHALDVDLLRRLARRFGRVAADVLEQVLTQSRAEK